MRTVTKAVQAIIANSLLVLLVSANVAIAVPVEAGWKNDVCWNPKTQRNEACCTLCIILCHCDLVSQEGNDQ